MDASELLQAEDDAKFERALLDSARRDVLPSQGDVQKALQRFTGALGVALVGSGDSVPFARAAHRIALKWLALGAVGGGMLVTVWFGTTLHRAPNAASVPSRQLAAATDSRASAANTGLSLAATAADARPFAPTAASSARAAPRSGSVRPSSHAQRNEVETAQGSVGQDRASAESLLAEVALLDSVRSKLDLGDSAGALLLIERYELKFPNGQLAKDADVLALEALAGTDDRAELTRRADRFLERSPDDPHAERVRRLRFPPSHERASRKTQPSPTAPSNHR